MNSKYLLVLQNEYLALLRLPDRERFEVQYELMQLRALISKITEDCYYNKNKIIPDIN